MAGGFAISEQSATVAGSATAGAGALAEDASTVFYNPAGMSYLENDELLIAGHAFVLDNDFDNEGTVDGSGTPVRGAGGATNGIVPLGSLFGVVRLNDFVHLGLGITAPFGLSSEYDDTWVGRYNTLLSGIATVDINPAISVRVADWLALGGGLSARYAKAERRSAIDFGSICFNNFFGPGVCSGLGLLPQGADGELSIEADDWGFGFNLGVLIAPYPTTRIGVSYRSSVHHTFEGDADFDVPAAASPLTFGGVLFQDTGAAAEISLPASLSVSLYQELTPELALLGDVTWMRWSSFDILEIRFDNPEQPDIVQEERWRDVFRYSLGLRYAPDDIFTFRFGFAYDETPIRDATRNPGIPGNDRLVFALGAGARVSDSIFLDFGYTYNHELDAPVRSAGADGGAVRGEYHNRVHILSAQLRWQF